jgi:hypothetical protein
VDVSECYSRAVALLGVGHMRRREFLAVLGGAAAVWPARDHARPENPINLCCEAFVKQRPSHPAAWESRRIVTEARVQGGGFRPHAMQGGLRWRRADHPTPSGRPPVPQQAAPARDSISSANWRSEKTPAPKNTKGRAKGTWPSARPFPLPHPRRRGSRLS